MNLTHVYSLNVLGRRRHLGEGGEGEEGAGPSGGIGLKGGFMDERAEYAHQAGRLGRLGNKGIGTITSIVPVAMEEPMMALIRDATSDDVDADVAPLSPERYEWGAAGSMKSLPEDSLRTFEEEGSGAPAVDEQEALGIGGSRGAAGSDASGILKEEQREEAIRRLEDLFELYETPEPEVP